MGKSGGREEADVHQPFLQHRQKPTPVLLSEELETMLSEEISELSVAQRYYRATLMEMKLLFNLAAPMVFVYMISYLMSMSTQMFAGHLGNLQLAAASLGNSGIQLFAYGLMVCLYFRTHFFLLAISYEETN